MVTIPDTLPGADRDAGGGGTIHAPGHALGSDGGPAPGQRAGPAEADGPIAYHGLTTSGTAACDP